MSVRVAFHCDGCDAVAEATGTLRKSFISVSGRDYGVGTAQWRTTPEDICPEGWVAADPYTYCTYCPKCWAEIDSGAESAGAPAGPPE